MAEAVRAALAAGALAASTLGPLQAAALLTARFGALMPAAARLTATGVVTAALVTAAFLVLTALHAFTAPAAAAVGLALGVGATLAWGRHGTWRDDAAALARFLRAAPAAVRVTAGAVALALLAAAARGLENPPLSWDSLTYHLVLAAKWVQTGARTTFVAPDGMDGYSHFPFNGEALAAWLLLPFHGDEVVNLLNLPFLVLAALAFYALAREFGLAPDLSSLLSAAVVTAPMAFAYATTSYVDPQVLAELVAAALFFFRYEREGRAFDLVLLGAALGLAMGTKPTAIWLTFLLGVFSVSLVVARRSGAAALAASFALLLLLGAPQYVENALGAGNPVYPVGLSFRGREVLPGSLYVARVASEFGWGTWRRDVENAAHMFQLSPWVHPRTAGPLIGLFVILALLTLVSRPPFLRERRRWMLAALWGLPLLAFYLDRTPNSVSSRRFWLDETSRFLGGPLALAVLAGGVQLVRPDVSPRLMRSFLSLAVIATLASDGAWCVDSWGGGVIAAVLAGSAFAVLRILRAPRIGRAAGAVFAVSLFIVASVGASLLRSHRDAMRWEAYAKRTDLHWVPRKAVDGWRWCDDPVRPRRIAFATGWEWSGHNWFLYPLLGRRLQNDVVYASVNRRGDVPTHVDRGLLRERFDVDLWLGNLREKRVDLVFVQSPEPPEVAWMRARPDLFTRAAGGDGWEVYAFSPGNSSR